MGMAPSDVRALLEGYDLEEKTEFVLPGTTVIGSFDVAMASVAGLQDLMFVRGTGLPEGAKIVTVGVGLITLDMAATAAGLVNLTFTTYLQISDSWLAARRDN